MKYEEKLNYNRQWQASHRDKMKEYNAKWVKNNPEKAQEMYRKKKLNEALRRVGLTRDQYDFILTSQNNLCAVCSSPPSIGSRTKRLAIDHNHETGRPRGLLCDRCNRAIGLLGDSVEILKKAIQYLEHHDSSL